MQIVIDIPDEQYEYLAKIVAAGEEPLGYFERVIMRGTQLPKGHGRLIDADALEKDADYSNYDGYYHAYSSNAIYHAPTIIEADKDQEYLKDVKLALMRKREVKDNEN